MAIEKTIEIDGRPVKFRASASVPRMYRIKFGRDVIQDMAQLQRSFAKAVAARNIPVDATDEERERATKEAQLSALDLTMFENVAYVMAKHGDPENVPSTADEWLDGFKMFDIYTILPQILDLWGYNVKSTAIPKNVKGRQHAR